MTVLIAIGENEDAEPVVELGYELAERYDDPVVALHVVPQEDFDDHKAEIESRSKYSDVALSQEQDSAGRYALRVVREAVPEFDDDRVECRGRIGDPADEILTEARETDARFLVIGGRRRSPVGKALFGSVTQQVLLEADAPVVTAISD